MKTGNIVKRLYENLDMFGLLFIEEEANKQGEGKMMKFLEVLMSKHSMEYLVDFFNILGKEIYHGKNIH